MPRVPGMVEMLPARLACETEDLWCSPAERRMSFLISLGDCGPELQKNSLSYESCFPSISRECFACIETKFHAAQACLQLCTY